MDYYVQGLNTSKMYRSLAKSELETTITLRMSTCLLYEAVCMNVWKEKEKTDKNSEYTPSPDSLLLSDCLQLIIFSTNWL